MGKRLRQGWQGSRNWRDDTAIGWEGSLCDTRFARFALCDAISVDASGSTLRFWFQLSRPRWLRLPAAGSRDLLLLSLESEPFLILCWLQVCFFSSGACSAMRVIVHKLGTQAVRPQCTAALQRSYGQPVPLRTITLHFKPFSSSKPQPLCPGPKTVYSQPMRYVSSAQKARELNQQGIDEQESSLDHALSEEREKQARTPWHREGADEPPVRRQRSAGAMTKG
jgi:hypothetical protein